ncbi:uncharacterized protein KRP23_5157 [Phytophthora ramorum]|uniref:uncharacterized protein n=1 Tax=Phytophthora ramorum TaxID=164328 RepID=UPI0030AA10D8|nr:hypothetical protein KRP23_5157 [Phytophthora ramorum]
MFKVYKNMAAFLTRVGTLVDGRVVDQLPLQAGAQIGSFGDNEQNSFIVQVPKVWFKLMAADTHVALADADSVALSEESRVEQLRVVVKNIYDDSLFARIAASQLKVYTDWNAYSSDPKQDSLLADATIEEAGKTMSTGRTRPREESKEEAEIRRNGKKGMENGGARIFP